MDLLSLQIDRRLQRVDACVADAFGTQRVELTGEAYARIAQSAQPLFDWAHGRLPASRRTPRDSTLVAFSIDALTRSLRLAYVAERTADLAAGAPPPSSMSPSLSWCDSDYDAHHTLLREAARTTVRELRPRQPDPPQLSADARWEYCYQHGGDGWELGRPPPPIVRYLETLKPTLSTVKRALVIGCGRGHEAIALGRVLAPIGAQVAALDIAPSAVAATRAAVAQAGLQDCLRAYQASLFDDGATEPLLSGSYDLVLEHTCYCAIEPQRRDEYAKVLGRLVKPGGRFVGLFYCHDYPGGPPYGCSADEVRGRLGKSFVALHEEVPVDSVLTRAGLEWLICAQRQP